MTYQFIRMPEAERLSGLKKPTILRAINAGLFPAPVRIAARAVAWPINEMEALNKARLAGRTDDEIKALVTRLVAERAAA